jgi:hypothetical protein
MDLVNKKEFLQKNGYCEFSLSEFNESFVSILEKIKYKLGDTDYIKDFKRLRFDYHNPSKRIQISDGFETYELCNDKKIECIQKYDEEGIAQIWLLRDAFFGNENYRKELENVFYEILKYFYGKSTQDVNMAIQWTLYNEGCFLKDHNDGQGDEYQNTCAILIYLNEEWDENWGGNLVLRNTKDSNDKNKKTIYKVIPKFGTVAIIDLEEFDTAHAVEKVIGEHNRFTILAFATSKEKRKRQIL